MPAQPGELDRGAIEHLGHLGVRLEERLGRDQELEVAELLAQPLGAGQPLRLAALGALAEVRGAGPEQALAVDGGDERVGVDRAGRGDEPHLQLAGPAPLAHDEVAQQALLGAPVPGAEALLARPGEHLLAGDVAALGGEQAVVHRHDLVPAAGGVEAAHQRPVGRGAERVLELVAVAPLLDRGDDRILREAVEPADPAQRVADLLGLDLELALVGQDLPRRAGMVGDRRDAVGRGREDLDRARLGVRPLGLADHRADAVARQRAGDEDDIAVEAGDAVAAVGEGVDGEFELRPAGGPRRGRGRGHGPRVARSTGDRPPRGPSCGSRSRPRRRARAGAGPRRAPPGDRRSPPRSARRSRGSRAGSA